MFNNPSVLNGGSNAIADGRNVSVKVFHTLMSMPEEVMNLGWTMQELVTF